MKYRVTNAKNESREIDEGQLPELCLRLCGGGFTASQTRRAMELQSYILQHGTGREQYLTIERIEVTA